MGVVDFISVRSERVHLPKSVEQVMAIDGKGLEGDHYNAKNGTRQVTLIQAEDLIAVASFLNRDKVDPLLARRNIVIREFNLNSLKGKSFQLGEAILQYTGECHPCSRMEQNLGEGGYHAMRGRGGIIARILKTGLVKVGDSLLPLD
ncbi:MAG: MOSC domain-containing protein [Cyclobacteriaceae bacterium]